ncbi:MAG: hypothetical protein SVZ03_16360 [Spirochaetota bacterium]|nr:hypothetical protein [Spirochaetota bacterium]
MNNNICSNCINKAICGKNGKQICDHFDIELTRLEILNMVNDLKTNNPTIIPTILDGVKKTYKINLAI